MQLPCAHLSPSSKKKKEKEKTAPKRFLIFQRMKAVLIFQEMKTPKKFNIFSQKKAFLIFQETETLKKIPYISGNETFLYLGNGTLKIFLQFRIELPDSKKKFLIFQEMELLYISGGNFLQSFFIFFNNTQLINFQTFLYT